MVRNLSAQKRVSHAPFRRIDSQVNYRIPEFLTQVINHPPVFPAYTSPIYSNMAYILLGFAYENITGKSISQGQLDFARILGMNSTTTTPPGDNVDAIIPRNDSYSGWSIDGGVQDP